MKRLLITSFTFVLGFVANARSLDNHHHNSDGILIVEGTYQQKNIYVLNPVLPGGVGFCTYEVRVNGKLTTDEWNSSAFEVCLDNLGLQQGDAVFIEIKYKNGCSPKVINPKVVLPRPTFHTESIHLNKDGHLKWTSSNESGALPFIIQIYKWNKWINITEVQGIGTPGVHEYSYTLDLVSGDNKVRVVQKGNDQAIKASPSARVYSAKQRVNWTYNKRKEAVAFSDETAYELYDKYGQIKKRGFGRNMKVENLKKGTYYMNYDAVTEKFNKK